MFKHGKTNKIYYSIREKINYYKDVISGKNKNVSIKTKRKAPVRLKTLNRLNNRSYDEPTLIITSDKNFGNNIDKPRLCVVIDKDDKGRLLVCNIEQRTSKTIILDKNINRQIGNKKRWIDKSDVYETKYISNTKDLSKYDKDKIKNILRKK